MSASALTNFVDIIYGGPQSFFERYVLGAPIGPDTWALTLGNLMHLTFEQVTKTGLSDEEAVEFYLEAVKKCDASEEDKNILREKGVENLRLDLEQFGSIIRQGLLLNPNAVITGKMFGNGIYFAPSARKSFGYTSCSGSYWARGNDNTGFMGLYATAYGDPYYPTTSGNMKPSMERNGKDRLVCRCFLPQKIRRDDLPPAR